MRLKGFLQVFPFAKDETLIIQVQSMSLISLSGNVIFLVLKGLLLKAESFLQHSLFPKSVSLVSLVSMISWCPCLLVSYDISVFRVHVLIVGLPVEPTDHEIHLRYLSSKWYNSRERETNSSLQRWNGLYFDFTSSRRWSKSLWIKFREMVSSTKRGEDSSECDVYARWTERRKRRQYRCLRTLPQIPYFIWDI